MKKEYWPFLGTCIYIGAWMLLLLVLWLLAWPGQPRCCLTTQKCFCEFVDLATFWGQPANSITNFAYVISGLAILIVYAKKGDINTASAQGQPPMNNFQHLTRFSYLYAFLTINIGIGSLYMHTSWREWAGFFDVYAMNMYVMFIFLYFIVHGSKWTWGRFLAVYCPIEVVMAILYLGNLVGDPNVVFGVFVGLTVIIEAIWLIRAQLHLTSVGRDWRWYVVSVALFMGGWTIWLLGQNNIWPCDPYTWFQPHAIWHILTGVAPWTIFIYLKSERSQQKKDARN